MSQSRHCEHLVGVRIGVATAVMLGHPPAVSAAIAGGCPLEDAPRLLDSDKPHRAFDLRSGGSFRQQGLGSAGPRCRPEPPPTRPFSELRAAVTQAEIDPSWKSTLSPE